MRLAGGIPALGDAEDCLRSLPKELAALSQLMRLSAEYDEPLGLDELRGVCDLLHLMAGQARQLEAAYDYLPTTGRVAR